MHHCLVMADEVAKLPFIVNKIITNQGVTRPLTPPITIHGVHRLCKISFFNSLS